MKITKNGMTKTVDQKLWQDRYQHRGWTAVTEKLAVLKPVKKDTVETPAVVSEVLSEEVVDDELKGD